MDPVDRTENQNRRLEGDAATLSLTHLHLKTANVHTGCYQAWRPQTDWDGASQNHTQAADCPDDPNAPEPGCASLPAPSLPGQHGFIKLASWVWHFSFLT